jgi:hypothetical protein
MPDAARNLSAREIEEIVQRTVEQTLIRLGVAVDDPIEVQKDFQHLRDWRVSMDQVRRKSFLTAVTIITTGMLGALWLGVKSYLNQ